MWTVIRKLLLGFSLIILASAILLISDWHQRKAVGGKTPRVAIVQHSATAVLDEGVLGVLDGLTANGLVDGQNISIKRFNADGDFTVANAIAGQVVAAGFDLVVTISTPSLQTVAKANSSERVIQVFGLVADPYRAGVGIGRKGGVFPARQETISRAPVRRCCVESKRSKFGNHDDAGARDLPGVTN